MAAPDLLHLLPGAAVIINFWTNPHNASKPAEVELFVTVCFAVSWAVTRPGSEHRVSALACGQRAVSRGVVAFFYARIATAFTD